MRVRILHLIKSLGRGGAEMLLPETLKLHDKDQFEFYYAYFLPWKNQMEESILQAGGNVKCFNANNNFELLAKTWAIASYVRQHKIQLIHAHLPWAGILARVVGKICNVPVIYTEHNKQERYHTGTRLMNLLTLNYLTMMIAVSHDVAKSIYKFKPKYAVPLRVVWNGVNTQHFNPDNFSKDVMRAKLNIPPNAFVIGTIAVFRFQKRLDLWIELAAKILERSPDAHFVIVGDGPLKEELLLKRQALGLQERIHMPGLEVEIRPYLSSFDLYMMCSIFEGLPVALLEAMAMGCPVISTDAGGVKEVIENGVDGLLCSTDEPEKLIDYAHGLSVDHAHRAQLKAQSRKKIVQSFSMEKMVRELEEIYHETIKQDRSPIENTTIQYE